LGDPGVAATGTEGVYDLRPVSRAIGRGAHPFAKSVRRLLRRRELVWLRREPIGGDRFEYLPNDEWCSHVRYVSRGPGIDSKNQVPFG